MPSSPPPQSGERAGGGVVTFLAAEWPGGGVGLSWRWRPCRGCWGGTVCLSTSRTHTSASPGHGRAQLVPDLPGGRDWTSVPGGHRASGGGAQGLEDSVSGARCPADSRPGLHPLSWVCFSTFPASQLPCLPGLRLLCSRLDALITACLSLSYLRLGPRQHGHPWPLSEGSPLAGAAASAAGSCSLSSLELGLGFQGLIREAGWATALHFPGLRPLHVHTWPQRPGQAGPAPSQEGNFQALALIHLPCYLGK